MCGWGMILLFLLINSGIISVIIVLLLMLTFNYHSVVF